MRHPQIYLNSLKQNIIRSDKELTVEMIAKRLNCSRQHIYNLIKSNELEAMKIGNKKGFRVRESELVRFLENNNTDEDSLQENVVL